MGQDRLPVIQDQSGDDSERVDGVGVSRLELLVFEEIYLGQGVGEIFEFEGETDTPTARASVVGVQIVHVIEGDG